MGQCIKHACRAAQYLQEDDAGGKSDDNQIPANLLHSKGTPEFAEQHQVIGIEVDTEQNHKDGDDPLQIGGVVHHAGVFDAKSAGAGSAKGGGQRIEQRHVPQQEQQDFDDRHPKIDDIQDACGVFDLGHQFADRGSRAFCAHQIDVRTTAQRQDGQQKDQYPHAANPMGEAAPEQRAVGQSLHIA